MHLTTFLVDLFTNGKVTVDSKLQEFDEDDLVESESLLRYFYEEDALSLALQAPHYSPDAALWGAKFLYRAIQLAMLRQLSGAMIEKVLEGYLGDVGAEVIYSADLCLRNLPFLIDFASQLAPNDILTQKLKATAHQWPFSSVGIVLTDEVDEEIILNNPSLRVAYIDRIIEKKDFRRVNILKKELVSQALGGHSSSLWPELIKNS